MLARPQCLNVTGRLHAAQMHGCTHASWSGSVTSGGVQKLLKGTRKHYKRLRCNAVRVQVSPRTMLLLGGISDMSALELPAFSVTIIATSPSNAVELPQDASFAAAAA